MPNIPKRLWATHSLLFQWCDIPVVYKKPPSQVMPPVRIGAKQTRHNPNPNLANTGKRKRQWR